MKYDRIKDKKILIVEDDPSTQEVISESLKMAGAIVETASNAKDALEKVRFWKPQLVISDHDMPGMNGRDMLHELRDNKNYVTVIIVSGRTDTDTVVDCLMTGADDYIKKPFRTEEFLARVDVSLRHNEAHRELFQSNQKLNEMVDLDYLTGLYNMRSIYDKIDYEIKRTKRYSRSMACIMIDMDHFKNVNDDNDHLFGSFVLQEMGKIIQENIREVDFAARYGGDEFLIVLCEITPEDAHNFCERLRDKISKYKFSNGESTASLTVSIGYSTLTHNEDVDSKGLVKQADHALYRAKKQGRNQVSV